ncbi:MAG: hypothetical protein KC964_19795 [Candidatus Omnitrophica bacterium]|nr:hypothetical protein [Candidatus Omnitrophota bacterium]
MDLQTSIERGKYPDQLVVAVSRDAIATFARNGPAIGSKNSNGRTSIDAYVESLRDYVTDQCDDLVKHLRAWKALKHIGLPVAMRRYKVMINCRGRIDHHEEGRSLESLIPYSRLGCDPGTDVLVEKLPSAILENIRSNLHEEIDDWLFEEVGDCDCSDDFHFASDGTDGLVLGQMDGQRYVIDELAKDSDDTAIVICA